MNRMPLLTSIATAAFLAFGLVADSASAAPLNLPERAMDLELREVDVRNVFKLLGDVGQRNLALDPCVQGKVDLKLKNTPLPLVFEALALKLHLTYEDDGAAIHVRCQSDAAATSAAMETHVSFDVREAPLSEIAQHLATAAKLEGVDYRAKAQPRITMTLNGVRLSTAVTALGDVTGLRLAVSGSRLVVAD